MPLPSTPTLVCVNHLLWSLEWCILEQSKTQETGNRKRGRTTLTALRKCHLVYVRLEEILLFLFEQVLEHEGNTCLIHLYHYDDDASDECHIFCH